MNIKLNVYESDMETVKKECAANTVKIPFGIIRKLMKLFDVEKLEDTAEILSTVMESWDDVIALIDRIFPDMEEDDWDYVDVKDLVKVVYLVLKYSFAEMLKIPTEKN